MPDGAGQRWGCRGRGVLGVIDPTGQFSSTNSVLHERSRALKGFQNENGVIRIPSANTEKYVHKWN